MADYVDEWDNDRPLDGVTGRPLSLNAFAKLKGVPRSTMKKYCRETVSKRRPLGTRVGRPSPLSDEVGAARRSRGTSPCRRGKARWAARRAVRATRGAAPRRGTSSTSSPAAPAGAVAGAGEELRRPHVQEPVRAGGGWEEEAAARAEDDAGGAGGGGRGRGRRRGGCNWLARCIAFANSTTIRNIP